MSMSEAPGHPKQASTPSGGRAVHDATSAGARSLRDIALARSGDKGNRATLSVIALNPADYPQIERLLTSGRVRQHLAGLVQGEVQRFALARLHAVHFVLHDALAGGVTRSLALDAHGKTLSAALLDLPLDD